MSGPLLYTKVNDRILVQRNLIGSEKSIVLCLGPQVEDIGFVDPGEFPVRADIRKIAAVIGYVRLKLRTYFLIAKRVEEVGKLNEHRIFKVVEYEIVPIGKSNVKDNDETQYLALLNAQLSAATLFFSYTYDLTNSAQRNEKRTHNSLSWKDADKRFFWNNYVTVTLQNYAKQDSRIDHFITPMIFGYAKFVDTQLNDTPLTIGLVTRRSTLRAGTRYFRRGIDADGNVANFNETEQFTMIHAKDKGGNSDFFSFLQTRGSIPLYWGEINNLKYKPTLVLGENSSLDATAKHFAEQKHLYGENYLVNLVNQKGHELPVKLAYESAVNALNDPKIHYTYFDFHHECRKMKYERVKLLIEHLNQMGLQSSDVFHKVVDSNGVTERVEREQSSVVRTNCMDCLDRTNVVQCVLAQWVIQNELETAFVVSPSYTWESDKELLFKFQGLWADNADAVSLSYSGTGALKTDFTRTGKRTSGGAFNDFLNSVSRYYQNNLTDGPRQDSFDLFLGNFKPYENGIQSPFSDRRPFTIQVIPTIIYAALTVIAATVFFPKGHFTSLKNLSFLIFSSVILGSSARFILQNGEQYVNWPKLNELAFLVPVQTYDKEHQFKGIKYAWSSKFSKPDAFKKD
ncbi:LAMI_0A08614g1_1 [Lachancea mirantina]|uniref:LAMI_0A08614g1_1 n=1 Tax=Lachancea mirantina TaxID=1230905 RepID=A0A1G4IRJ2_9SACH|nr:LAMI_0A08614g1_1 [Lachancea mirantina]